MAPDPRPTVPDLPRRGIALAVMLATLAGMGALAVPTASSQASSDDWPQILGPDRDGRSSTTVSPWPDVGLQTRWREPVGEGFAGPAIVDNRLILCSPRRRRGSRRGSGYRHRRLALEHRLPHHVP